jgi:hypothetical protein
MEFDQTPESRDWLPSSHTLSFDESPQIQQSGELALDLVAGW